ncbi:hypothetical protein ACI796_21550 [Geodermatophilus sp. SYSU D00525]
MVGEPDDHGTEWWLSLGSAKPFVTAGAPAVQPGTTGGSTVHATLDRWGSAFSGGTGMTGDSVADRPAGVLAFGFPLGSGVEGDGVIESMSFAGTTTPSPRTSG